MAQHREEREGGRPRQPGRGPSAVAASDGSCNLPVCPRSIDVYQPGQTIRSSRPQHPAHPVRLSPAIPIFTISFSAVPRSFATVSS